MVFGHSIGSLDTIEWILDLWTSYRVLDIIIWASASKNVSQVIFFQNMLFFIVNYSIIRQVTLDKV